MNQAIETLCDFIRFPSISTDPKHVPDLRACTDWLMNLFRNMGLAVERYETPGHPVVVAKNSHKKGKKNVLIYGHYDVQPVDPLNLWTHPPFEPTIVNGILYGRGSTDNKGQILAHIWGVQESLKKNPELPVNITFLVEGEEEIGSPSLKPFLDKHKSDLACDLIVISDTGMVGHGIPTLTYGLRGIVCLEVRVRGPKLDLHSGIFGGAVMNPLLALARLMNSFHDREGRILVEGFSDPVQEIADWERKSWSTLPDPDEEFRKLTGVKKTFGEKKYSSRERTWARPTVEFNGIGGGFQGEGTKTVIPSTAFLKISARLVPNQDPRAAFEQIKKHIARHMPEEVEYEVLFQHDGRPYLSDPFSSDGKAAQRALKSTFGRECVFIREGGTIPIVRTFKDILGADTLLLGLALPDCRAHSPDENFPLDIFEKGIALNQNLLEELES